MSENKILALKFVVFLLLLTFILYTVNVWFHIQTVFGGEGEISLTKRVLVNMPSIIAFSILLMMRLPRVVPRTELYWLRVIFLVVFFSGVMQGVAKVVLGDTTIRYLLGDVFRFLMPWVSLYAFYLAAIFLLRMDKQCHGFFHLILKATIILCILDALATIYISITFPFAKISTQAYVILVFYGFFFFRYRPVLSALALIIGLMALVFAGKRGNLFAVPFVLVCVAVLYVLVRSKYSVIVRSRFGGIYSLIFYIAAFGMLVVFSAYVSNVEFISTRSDSVLAGLGQTIADIVDAGSFTADASMLGRVNENRNILEYYYSNPWFILFGAGFGAEIDMVYNTGVKSVSGGMHHAHMAWAVYFLRNGLFGLLLLVTFYVFIVKLILQRWAIAKEPYSAVSLCIIIFAFILSFKSNIMLENSPVAFIVFLFVALSTVSSYMSRKERLSGKAL